MLHYFNRYFVFKLLTVSVFFFVTSCSIKPEPPLRIGINLWPGYEFLHVASVLDLYEENSINIVELSNATTVMQMLRNDQLEGAALTLDEALTLIDEGLDLKIILVTDISNGGDALLVKPEIETLQFLKDKSIAVENTAVGAIMLYSILKQANLKLSDIDVIP